MSVEVTGDEGISTGVSEAFKRLLDEFLVLGFDSRRLTTPVPPMILQVFEPVLLLLILLAMNRY